MANTGSHQGGRPAQNLANLSNSGMREHEYLNGRRPRSLFDIATGYMNGRFNSETADGFRDEDDNVTLSRRFTFCKNMTRDRCFVTVDDNLATEARRPSVRLNAEFRLERDKWVPQATITGIDKASQVDEEIYNYKIWKGAAYWVPQSRQVYHHDKEDVKKIHDVYTTDYAFAEFDALLTGSRDLVRVPELPEAVMYWADVKLQYKHIFSTDPGAHSRPLQRELDVVVESGVEGNTRGTYRDYYPHRGTLSWQRPVTHLPEPSGGTPLMRGEDDVYWLYRGCDGNWLRNRTTGWNYRLAAQPVSMEGHVLAELASQFPATDGFQEWTCENEHYGKSRAEVVLFARTDRDKRLIEVNGHPSPLK